MPREETAISQRTASPENRICRIQVALDATQHSRLIVENLHHYISSGSSTTGFLYVQPQTQPEDHRFLALDEEASQETVRVVNQQFDEYAGILSSHQLPVSEREFITHAESVEQGILDFVEDNPPDLLVLGMSRDISKQKGWQISSTSYAIATHAPCSVLVLKNPRPHGGALKVLFATDGSAHAQRAATDLRSFLPTENTEIRIFYVVSVNYYILPIAEPYINYLPLEQALTGEAVGLMERTRSDFEKAGYKVSDAYFKLGDPVEQILQEAEENGVDLVVVGSHGTGGRLAKWLLGSVSSKVLEYARTSVAILK